MDYGCVWANKPGSGWARMPILTRLELAVRHHLRNRRRRLRIGRCVVTTGAPWPGPHAGGQRFAHRTAEPGTRPYVAWLYQVAVRRYALHTGATARQRQRRRLPWRKR